MSLKPSAEVLSNVPKFKKVVMCLRQKIRVLDKLHSGMNDGAVGCEFNINKSIIFCLNKVALNKNTHKIRLCIYRLITIRETSRNLILYFL